MCKNHSYPQSYSRWKKKNHSREPRKKIKKLNQQTKNRHSPKQRFKQGNRCTPMKAHETEPTKANWLYRRTRREELNRTSNLSSSSSSPFVGQSPSFPRSHFYPNPPPPSPAFLFAPPPPPPPPQHSFCFYLK